MCYLSCALQNGKAAVTVLVTVELDELRATILLTKLDK